MTAPNPKIEDIPYNIIWEPLPGSQVDALTCPADEILFHGTRGPGKGLPLGEPVYTDSGPVSIGNLRVGHSVACPDGTTSKIIGVFPQGMRPTYELEFSDGSIARCDDQHLWAIHIQGGSNKGGIGEYGYRLMPMLDILRRFRTDLSKLHVPTLDSLKMRYKTHSVNNRLPIEPYMLGLLLGDGSFRQNGSYCTNDDELADAMLSAGATEWAGDSRNTLRSFSFPPNVKQSAIALGLHESLSNNKFVPEVYLHHNDENRLALLQGLMDTDGAIDPNGYMTFGSTSLQLSKDVQYLARSLGANATLTTKPSYLNGVRHQDCHEVYIQPGNKFVPFRLSRKVERVKGYMHPKLWKAIVAIRELGEQETVCIKIDHPLGLFITRDFVVTHNTDCQLMRFRMRVGQGYGKFWRGVIFDRQYKNLDDIVAKSQRWFYAFDDGAKFMRGQGDYRWVWPTGEELLIRTLKDNDDYMNFHGQEFPYIGWNELTKYATPELYEAMMSCNRSSFRPEDHPVRNPDGSEFLLPKIPLEVFSTTNPYGCVPYGEVLTSDRGWIDIKDIRPGDSVITCDSDGVARSGLVSAVTNAPWDGLMYSRKGRGLHMEFTPTHRFAHLDTAKRKHTVKPYLHLPGQAFLRRAASNWVGEDVETLHGFDAADFMELLGWFISEGCMVTRSDSSERNSFIICQSKLPTRSRIELLLQKMKIHYRKDDNNFTATNSVIADIFREQGKCRQKHIPREYLNLSTALLARLFESLMLGDGCGTVYYTTSKQLADDFCELATKLGYAPFISSRQREGRDDLSYEINHGGNKVVSLITENHVYDVTTNCASGNVEPSLYVGRVYCLTVPGTETFFVRQNGCVWLSGNSGHHWVKERFIDAGKPGQLIKDVTNVYNPQTQQREDITKTRVHLFGSYRENKYLDPKYIATLENTTDPNRRKAWLYGSWDITSGGMFDDLWDSNIHVLPKFTIPRGWRIDRSFDWGSSRPFSVGWWAESDGSPVYIDRGDGVMRQRTFPRGTLVRIGEWYGAEPGSTNKGLFMQAYRIGLGIKEREVAMGIADRVKAGPADSSIFDTTDEASIYDNMHRAGITFHKADKKAGSRINGWQLCRDYLEASKRYPDRPGLYVMDHCKAFLKFFVTLPRDEANPDDVDTNAEDHIGDEVRYRVLASRSRPFAIDIGYAV